GRKSSRLEGLSRLGMPLSGDAASLRRPPRRRGSRRERKAQGTNDAHDRTEFGITGLPERLIEALAVQPGILCDLSHATCTGNETKRIAHEIRIASLERCRDIRNLTFFGVEIVGGVKSCRLAHSKVSASI